MTHHPPLKGYERGPLIGATSRVRERLADTGHGECRLPASWRLLYQDAGEWKEVSEPAATPVTPDQWNALSFRPVETASLRIETQLQPGFSGGLLGWRVK